jgi:translation elongation factor EF-Tu-like GTPase
MAAKFKITNTFKIAGRGLVLGGFIEEGVVSKGDFIEFSALSKKRRRMIIGIGAISKSEAGATTGLFIKYQDQKELEDLLAWKPKGVTGLISKDGSSQPKVAATTTSDQ